MTEDRSQRLTPEREWILERLVYMAGKTNKRETERHVRQIFAELDASEAKAETLQRELQELKKTAGLLGCTALGNPDGPPSTSRR